MMYRDLSYQTLFISRVFSSDAWKSRVTTKNDSRVCGLSLHLEILHLSDSVAFSLDYFELWLSARFVHNIKHILILSMKYVNQPIVTRRL